MFRRVAAGGHADLLTVEPTIDPKSKKLRDVIVVPDARAAADFLHLTPAEGGWRVVVIDSADELNPHAANAILKFVEEPPARALVLIVSHTPSRLLPTIRSRCRKLTLNPLPTRQIADILATRVPGMEEGERASLARLADGSVGRALAMAEAGRRPGRARVRRPALPAGRGARLSGGHRPPGMVDCPPGAGRGVSQYPRPGFGG